MNPRLAAIQPSLIRTIAAKRRESSIDFGLGEPTLQPTPTRFTSANAWIAQHGCRYTVNAGAFDVRERIAQHYQYQGMNAAENVCITSGSQEGMYAAITALLDPATDEILIVEPAFGAYAKVASLAGLCVRTVALDIDTGFAFDAERILAQVSPRTRMVVICSPCNPTGRVLRNHEAGALAQGLLAMSGQPPYVLFDEVYRELTYVEDAAAFGQLYPYTIVINSLSKSNALTGLRLGWVIGPKIEIDAVTRMHAWTTSAASTFAQRIAYEIFSQPGAISEHGTWYRTRSLAVTQLLQRFNVHALPIEGTFYTMLRLPEGVGSMEAALTLAKEDDVLLIPGAAFGTVAEGWLRMSWVAMNEELTEGLRRFVARFG